MSCLQRSSVRSHSRLVLLAAACAGGFLSPSGLTGAADNEADAYFAVVTGRAEKIVAGMALDPASERGGRLVQIIAEQYRDLRAIHDSRDAAEAAIEAVEIDENDLLGASVTLVRAASDRAVEDLHRSFLARLAAFLSPTEIEAVKEGMTYGRMTRDYDVYMEMLPDLTTAQKRQVYAWMWEARERAMDGGSSEEKHWWFDKYKGRINNYLSAAGIDLKQAEADLYERRRRAAAAGGN